MLLEGRSRVILHCETTALVIARICGGYYGDERIISDHLGSVKASMWSKGVVRQDEWKVIISGIPLADSFPTPIRLEHVNAHTGKADHDSKLNDEFASSASQRHMALNRAPKPTLGTDDYMLYIAQYEYIEPNYLLPHNCF